MSHDAKGCSFWVGLVLFCESGILKILGNYSHQRKNEYLQQHCWGGKIKHSTLKNTINQCSKRWDNYSILEGFDQKVSGFFCHIVQLVCKFWTKPSLSNLLLPQRLLYLVCVCVCVLISFITARCKSFHQNLNPVFFICCISVWRWSVQQRAHCKKSWQISTYLLVLPTAYSDLKVKMEEHKH